MRPKNTWPAHLAHRIAMNCGPRATFQRPNSQLFTEMYHASEGWHPLLPYGSTRLRHLAASSLSASALMNTPPTTDRAWKPTCLPFTVSYQSVSGTRLG